jgi:small-conductance mechanosensitive channel
VGGIVALGTLGIDVSALVAGLGLTGLAIGLALKEIISNALAGILVIIYKPFKENDRVGVTTFEGRVTEINLRFTTLESGGKKIYIPNAMVISNAVVVDKTPPAEPPAEAEVLR